MDQLIITGIQLGLGLILIALGFGMGRYTERNHFKRLDEQEWLYRGMLVTSLSRLPLADQCVGSTMVVGECVIATDYFKSFVTKLKKIIGGELRAYLSLMDRARRESIIRLIEDARAQGFDAVCNIRFVSADVGGSTSSRKGSAMVAIIASGTAYKRIDPIGRADASGVHAGLD